MTLPNCYRCERTDQHGLYDGSWKGLIVAEAFQHPAKFARGLICWIVEHGLEKGYWAKGDVIGDPFAGIGTGGIIAASNGLRWLGVELEQNFVDLAEKNFEKHRRTWEGFGDPQPVIVQGDSREFARIVGEVAGVVTSPPYAEAKTHPSLGHPELVDGGKGDYLKLATTGTQPGSECYGQTPGQIGSLPAGQLDAVVTSPPFADSDQPCASQSKAKKDYHKFTRGDGTKRDHQMQSEGNIGSLPAGKIDAAITSPPYAESIGRENQIDYSKAKGPHDGLKPSPARDALGGSYGTTPGQIGALKEGEVDAVVTSPPFEDSIAIARHHTIESGETIEVRKKQPAAHAVASYLRERRLTKGMKRSEIDRLMGTVTLYSWYEGRPAGVQVPTPAAWRKLKIILDLDDRFDSEMLDTELRLKRDLIDTGHHHVEEYGSTNGQIGNESAETYWQAVAEVYRQMHLAMKPGGVVAIVLKDYVKNKQRVPLCDDTCKLLESCGFHVFERTRAWLVKESTHPDLFGGEDHVTRTERKSFFRRLAEAKGSPRIDWEEVIWARRLEQEVGPWMREPEMEAT